MMTADDDFSNFYRVYVRNFFFLDMINKFCKNRFVSVINGCQRLWCLEIKSSSFRQCVLFFCCVIFFVISTLVSVLINVAV
jgi:hypothetical protein